MEPVHFNKEEIRKFKLGVVVEIYSISTTHQGWAVQDVGHVTGFERNSTNEVVVKVRRSNGDEDTYHPFHLEVI